MTTQTRGTLRDVLYTLFSYRWLTLLTFVVVAGAGIVFTMLSPRIYEASSKINLAINYERLRITQTEANTRLNVEQMVATEIEILKSWTLLETAMDTMEAHGKLPQGTLSGAVMANLRIEAVRNTTFIEVRYRSSDPDFCRDMVNQLVHSYSEFRQNAGESDDQLSNYEKMIGDIDQRIEESESELSEYNADRDIAILSAQQGQELDQIGKLRSGLLERELSLAQENARLQSMQEVERNFDPVKIQPDLLVANGPLQSMFNAYNELYRDRLMKSSMYTPENPEMKVLDQRLGQMKAELKTLYATSITGQRQKLALLESEKAMLQQQLVNATQRKRELSRASSRQAILQKKLDDLQSVRTVINQKLEETRILSVSADRMEIQQISPAQRPMQPIKPKVLFNTVASLLLGLVLAFSLPFYLQVMDSRVHTDMDVFKSTGLHTLSVVRLYK
ncbi:MAG: hypothetical protein H6678_01545 [Candidatus Delongbacteria bacterium]|nr:hypothetical protein [Candidatus Delongbacteria bacterium]